ITAHFAPLERPVDLLGQRRANLVHVSLAGFPAGGLPDPLELLEVVLLCSASLPARNGQSQCGKEDGAIAHGLSSSAWSSAARTIPVWADLASPFVGSVEFPRSPDHSTSPDPCRRSFKKPWAGGVRSVESPQDGRNA